MGRSAGARPLAHVERHPALQGAAGRAQLGRGEPPVHGDHLASVPVGLVLQHGPQLGPGRVTDGTRQPPVPEHVPDGQILDHDRLVLTNESSGELVQEVPAPVGNSRVSPPDPESGLRPIRTVALGLAGEIPLGPGEAFPVLALVPRVGDPLPGGERHQAGDTDVDTHGIVDRCGHGRAVVAQHGDEPASGRVLRHRHRRRGSARRQRTGPHDVQRIGHLRQGQPAVPEPEAAGGVLGGTAGLLPGLERRVLRPLLPEVAERPLQVPERLLQRHRRHLGEVGQLLGLLPPGQHRAGRVVVDPLPTQRPRLGTGRKRHVVDLANTPERAQQLGRLRIGRIEAVLERPLHASGRHGSHTNTTARDHLAVNHLPQSRTALTAIRLPLTLPRPSPGGAPNAGTPIPPRPQDRGFLGGIR